MLTTTLDLLCLTILVYTTTRRVSHTIHMGASTESGPKKRSGILKPSFFRSKPQSSSKALLKMNFFSWWPSLLCWILKCRNSSWDLQYLFLKGMLKSKWLSLVLDVDFMTLTILKLEFSFIFLEFYLRASSQNFAKTINLMWFYCTLNKF